MDEICKVCFALAVAQGTELTEKPIQNYLSIKIDIIVPHLCIYKRG